jgi:hypothetical protein
LGAFSAATPVPLIHVASTGLLRRVLDLKIRQIAAVSAFAKLGTLPQVKIPRRLTEKSALKYGIRR